MVGRLACVVGLKLDRPKFTEQATQIQERRNPKLKSTAYRRWHPWEQGACGLHGGRARGR
jgi:hypothetical protein